MYSDEMLKEEAGTFLREERARERVQLSKTGQLDARIEQMVARCRKRAESLEKDGTPPKQAWFTASPKLSDVSPNMKMGKGGYMRIDGQLYGKAEKGPSAGVAEPWKVEVYKGKERAYVTGRTRNEAIQKALAAHAPRPKPEPSAPPSTDAPTAPDTGPDGMEVNVAKIKQSFGKSESIPLSGEDTAAPVKPKRGRPPKAKPAKSESAPDPENTPIVLPKQLALGDGTLYQGHWGAGIGNLKRDNEEKRDGDKDTVVSERRPKKSDSFKQSPVPITGELRGRFARLAEKLQADGKQVKDGKSLRRQLNRKPELKLKTPWRAPTIRVTRK